MNVERNFPGSYAFYVMENHHIILQPLDILHEYFGYLSPKNELKDLHSAKQWVFAEEIANGKIIAALLKAKRVQVSAFNGMTDLQIRDQ